MQGRVVQQLQGNDLRRRGVDNRRHGGKDFATLPRRYRFQNHQVVTGKDLPGHSRLFQLTMGAALNNQPPIRRHRLQQADLGLVGVAAVHKQDFLGLRQRLAGKSQQGA